jgi:demethylmenaquinone methyltransferase / 2-methoxy-6-polyprenyl-1,4-benzoquinol methylase
MSKKKYIDFGYENILADDKAKKVGEIFTKVAPKYDLMNDAMSFGMHRLWKRYFVKIANIQPENDICDLASGSADIALLMAHKIVDGSITISDINADMLEIGYDKMINNGYAQKVKKVLANAEELPFDDASFDLVTMSFGLRNVTDKKLALKEMFRITRSGGKVLVMEFSEPKANGIKLLYDKFSFNMIPRLGEYIANDYDSYEYLVESIRRHPKQEELKEWFYAVGFDSCKVYNIHTGVVAIHEGMKF